MSINSSDNDTLYIQLIDMMEGFQPKNEFPRELMYMYAEDLRFPKEGDIFIVGTFIDCLQFIAKILDDYIKFQDSSSDIIEIDISDSNPSKSTNGTIIMDFLYAKLEPQDYVGKKKLIVKGNVEDYEYFYQYLKCLEFKRHSWIHPLGE